MGMNMLSKGVEAVLTMIKSKWPETVDVISISGNYCIGKMINNCFD
jgi:hydroxymethylglutaryl-CoA reductase